MSDLPAYRAKLRGVFSENYNGALHFVFANVVILAAIAAAATQLHAVQPWEWLALPIAFLVANVVEWWAHRGPMHHRRAPIDLLFERHTLTHHHYFPHDDMAVQSHHQWAYILFPWWAVFLVIATAVPLAALAGLALGWNVGILFFITALGYYLLYEYLHLLYHLPESHPLAGNGIVRRMRQHHVQHHDWRLMQRYNFNVTFPISDALFHTRYRGPLEEKSIAEFPGEERH